MTSQLGLSKSGTRANKHELHVLSLNNTCIHMLHACIFGRSGLMQAPCFACQTATLHGKYVAGRLVEQYQKGGRFMFHV